jgi:hypothetical protein
MFSAWLKAMRRASEEREMREYEREQLEMRVKEQTAENHRNRGLKRRAYRGIRRVAG